MAEENRPPEEETTEETPVEEAPVEETPTAEEALRAGRAAQVLRTLLEHPADVADDPLLQALLAPERR